MLGEQGLEGRVEVSILRSKDVLGALQSLLPALRMIIQPLDIREEAVELLVGQSEAR